MSKAAKKKEEERIEKIIRNLLKLPENRRCINCTSLVWAMQTFIATESRVRTRKTTPLEIGRRLRTYTLPRSRNADALYTGMQK